MWSDFLFIAVHLLYGCWVAQVDSQTTVSRPVRHTLPNELVSGLFGSPVNGGCSSISEANVCNGTSVLSDGISPALSGVQDMPQSPVWANQLFTMNRSTNNERIIVSFEVPGPGINHNQVELSVFNCPSLGISAPQVTVYTDDKLRVLGPQNSLGLLMVADENLTAVSCDHLLKFCVQFDTTTGIKFLNLVFPYQNDSDHVFLGEVTFLNGGPQCGPPEIISMPVTLQPLTTDPATASSPGLSSGTTSTAGTSTQITPETESTTILSQPLSRDSTPIIVAVVVVVVLLLLIALTVVLIVVVMWLMKRRRKQETDRVHQLQNVVLETEEKQEDSQRYVDGPNDFYSSVEKPPQNGVKANVTAGGEVSAATDPLYSKPDKVNNDTYSHLRDGEKKTLTQMNSGSVDDQYSQLNRSLTDPGPTNARRSPTPRNQAVDEGAMYAVPDKKKQSDATPVVPEKSSELVEYLEIKETQSTQEQEAPEYSEIETSGKHGNSTGPIALSNRASREFLEAMSSNPLYHPTDIRPLHMMPPASLPQSHPAESGLLDVNAIYAEPLPPPSTHEPEWDPDQNIYESIYSEPLNPSLFMQTRESEDDEELHPYSSIYTVPTAPLTEKPLSVSMSNIKEIKLLGDGNFGKVVLAQTVGLTPKDLRLEGDAPYMLVAVKKLKSSASSKNRQLFDKEVGFMSRLNHPNVIRLLGVCTEGATPFIMMEYMMKGDLNEYLKGFSSIGDETPGSISLSTLVYMCTQIAGAMHYLASKNFVHRDLATRNCLVGSKDTIKIADFGMSRSLYESQYYVISGHAILPIRWMATECFYGKFSAKTDVWAFGVTMWEIFTLVKVVPYDHLEDHAVVEEAVRGVNRTLLQRPAQCPENVYEIMRKCWCHDATQRPTFDELYDLISTS